MRSVNRWARFGPPSIKEGAGCALGFIGFRKERLKSRTT